MNEKINGGCTPRGFVKVDYDPNPNGLPVCWLNVEFDNHTRVDLPMNLEATNKLILQLQDIRNRML